jgi:hypothetical protein
MDKKGKNKGKRKKEIERTKERGEGKMRERTE